MSSAQCRRSVSFIGVVCALKCMKHAAVQIPVGCPLPNSANGDESLDYEQVLKPVFPPKIEKWGGGGERGKQTYSWKLHRGEKNSMTSYRVALVVIVHEQGKRSTQNRIEHSVKSRQANTQSNSTRSIS